MRDGGERCWDVFGCVEGGLFGDILREKFSGVVGVDIFVERE